MVYLKILSVDPAAFRTAVEKLDNCTQIKINVYFLILGKLVDREFT
jgi:hypothetical protein